MFNRTMDARDSFSDNGCFFSALQVCAGSAKQTYDFCLSE